MKKIFKDVRGVVISAALLKFAMVLMIGAATAILVHTVVKEIEFIKQLDEVSDSEYFYERYDKMEHWYKLRDDLIAEVEKLEQEYNYIFEEDRIIKPEDAPYSKYKDEWLLIAKWNPNEILKTVMQDTGAVLIKGVEVYTLGMFGLGVPGEPIEITIADVFYANYNGNERRFILLDLSDNLADVPGVAHGKGGSFGLGTAGIKSIKSVSINGNVYQLTLMPEEITFNHHESFDVLKNPTYFLVEDGGLYERVNQIDFIRFDMSGKDPSDQKSYYAFRYRVYVDDGAGGKYETRYTRTLNMEELAPNRNIFLAESSNREVIWEKDLLTLEDFIFRDVSLKRKENFLLVNDWKKDGISGKYPYNMEPSGNTRGELASTRNRTSDGNIISGRYSNYYVGNWNEYAGKSRHLMFAFFSTKDEVLNQKIDKLIAVQYFGKAYNYKKSRFSKKTDFEELEKYDRYNSRSDIKIASDIEINGIPAAGLTKDISDEQFMALGFTRQEIEVIRTKHFYTFMHGFQNSFFGSDKDLNFYTIKDINDDKLWTGIFEYEKAYNTIGHLELLSMLYEIDGKQEQSDAALTEITGKLIEEGPSKGMPEETDTSTGVVPKIERVINILTSFIFSTILMFAGYKILNWGLKRTSKKGGV